MKVQRITNPLNTKRKLAPDSIAFILIHFYICADVLADCAGAEFDYASKRTIFTPNYRMKSESILWKNWLFLQKLQKVMLVQSGSWLLLVL